MAGLGTICRTSLALCLLPVLAACSDSPVALKAVRAMRATVFGAPDLDITRETVSKVPYASMSARVGRGVPALLLLSHSQGDDRYWRAGGEAVVVLRHGRIVHTAGFAENIVGARILGEDPLEYGLHRLTGEREYALTLDTRPGGSFEQPIDCRLTPIGDRKITIVEIEFDTVLVEEACRARLVPWTYTNRYWVDPVDGFVWQSEQHFVRSQPAMKYSVLKPGG